ELERRRHLLRGLWQQHRAWHRPVGHQHVRLVDQQRARLGDERALAEHRGQLAQEGGWEGRAHPPARISPFSRRTTRRARFAALASWVTITMVLFNFLF